MPDSPTKDEHDASNTQARQNSIVLDSNAYFRISQSLLNCKTLSDIEVFCADFVKTHDALYFVHSAYLPMIESVAAVQSTPGEWLQLYKEMGFFSIDPRIRHGFSSSSPIRWKDLHYRDGPKGKKERSMMEQARVYGMADGISVPVHGAGLECGILNMSSPEKLPDYSAQTLHGITLFAQSVQKSIKRIAEQEQLAGEPVAMLTDREAECLKWTAAGKTAREISQILEISESTVTFHLSNSIDKLSVCNKSQAVAKAIATSRINLF